MNIFLRLSTLPALLFAATCAFAQTGLFNAEHRGVVTGARDVVLPVLVSAPERLQVGRASEFTLEVINNLVVNNRRQLIRDCRPVLENPDGFELAWRVGEADGPFRVGWNSARKVSLEVTPTELPAQGFADLVFGVECRDLKENQVPTTLSRTRVIIEEVFEEVLPFSLTLGSGDEDTIFIDTDSGEGFLDWSLSLPADSEYDYLRLYFSRKPRGLPALACSHLTGCRPAIIERGAEATGWLTAYRSTAEGSPPLEGTDADGNPHEYKARLSVHGFIGKKRVPIKGWNIKLRALEKPLYCASLSSGPTSGRPFRLEDNEGWAFFFESLKDKPFIQGAYATDFLIDAATSGKEAVMRHADALTHRRSGAAVAGIPRGGEVGGLFQARVHPSASRFQLYMRDFSSDDPRIFYGVEGNLKNQQGEWVASLTVPVAQLNSHIRSANNPVGFPEAYHRLSSGNDKVGHYVGPVIPPLSGLTLTLDRSDSGICW